MDYDLYDDHALVDGILNNNGKLIEYFFNKKCSGLFAYIIENIFDGNVDKQDLSQELFLYLAKNNWYKVRQFDFRSKLMTWVTVVAVRFFQKKRKELIEKTGSMPLNDKMWQEQSHAIYIDQRMDLHIALAKMPNTRYRKVIEVLDLQEVRPDILAKEMNVTVDNLYNIHRRALAQLRLVIGRKEDYYG
ncbi:MAG: sigma-70 family RNA polymerase sigma factor [Prevotella sp.]|nr:sigma-70 family RNA polymerase sigma factor [Prevotella sp.]